MSRTARAPGDVQQDLPALTISEIARRAELPLPTPSRLVAELVARSPRHHSRVRR
ncbi:helix-turn-helix domain-containing protein [Streptomyces sp. NPDC048611]|uniref:helix-turn-helix domain-containing protein n=1 Tax=Streptomyces sp. NPDC048611 TaxID=3155635 RepID=UPI00343C53D0